MSNLPYISPDILKSYQEVVARSSSPSTLKRKSISLNRFFDWAEGQGHISQNPFGEIRNPKSEIRNNVETKTKKPIALKTYAIVGLTTSLIVLLFLLTWKLKFPIPFVQNFAQEITSQNSQNITQNTSPITATSAGTLAWNLYAKLKLTDTNGAPQVGSQSLSFKLYNSKDSTTPVYTSQAQTVTTDADGSTLISLDSVPSDIFFQNNQLFLEPQLGSSATSVRIPVETANTAANLGGYFPADPETGANANEIPVISSDGSLLLASQSPAIKAKNGNLLIEGQTVTIKSADGGGGNIEINPDANGYAHFLFEGNKGNFLNAQAPNLTSGSLYYGMVPNNSTGYYLINLQAGSKLKTKFSVDAVGNTNMTGDLSTGGIDRLTNTGSLQNITGYSQTGGNFTINQNPGDFVSITKDVTTGSALNDVMTLTLDERGKPLTANSDYSTLVLNRYDGNGAGAALKVNAGNAIFNGQIQLGRFSSVPSAIGQASIIYNTTDNLIYYWDGSTWQSLGSAVATPFSLISSGTNTSATMIIGTGASLSTSGTGTISATDLTCSGCVSNSELANSAITINSSGILTGGGSVSLGGTLTLTATEADTLNSVTTRGATTANAVSVGDLTSTGTTTFGGQTYTWPSTQTATGFLQDTNGTGTLAWTTSLPSGTTVGFDKLTSGTNVVAAMVVGAGASLDYTSTGTINASSLEAKTWEVPGTIGLTTPNSGAFTTLTSNGNSTIGTGASTVNTFGAGSSSTNTIGSGTTPGSLTLHGATSLDNTFSQTYSSPTGNQTSLNHTNSGSSGTNVSKVLSLAITGTDNATGTNAVTGIDIPNITAHTNNSYYGIVAGTGLTDILRYGSTQLISGAGILQSAALSGTYSNALTFSSTSNVLTGTIGQSTPLAGSFTTLSATGNSDTQQLIVKGNATQTSNLAEFQNSGGTVEASIDNTGNLNFTGALMPGGLAGTSGYVLTSAGAGVAPTWTAPGSLGVKWNSITNPDGNLSLTMGTNTTAFNWATGTSTNNLFSLTSDASANGTGSLLNIQTGASSTLLPLRVRAGATEALAVKADGNVGIGTTNPGSKLEVNGGNVAFINTNTLGFIPNYSALGEIPASTLIYSSDNLSLIPSNAGTAGKKVTIDYFNQSAWYSGLEIANVASGFGNLLLMKSGGNVGIGTTSPTAKLQIVGSADTQQLIVKGNATQTTNLAEFQNSTGTVETSIDNSGNIVATGNVTGVTLNGTTGVNTGAGAGTQRIDSSGNLKTIGTTQFNTQTYTWPATQTATGFLQDTDGSGTLAWTTSLPSGTTVGFDKLTSGTNVTAAMVVGAGATLNYTSTGTINASSLEAKTWEVPGTIGSTTPNTGTFSTLTATGDIAANGGNITTNQTTVNLLNATATTINMGGAGTTINIGPIGNGASTIVLSGGSTDTGCTLDGSNGNLVCSGTVTASGGITATNIAFSGITTGTNSVATMLVDTGASLNYANSGTINASSLIGATWVAPGSIGLSTPNAGAFTTLTSSGNSTIGTGASTTNNFGSGASSINVIGSTTTPGSLLLHGAATLDNTFTVSGNNLTTLGGNLAVNGPTSADITSTTTTASLFNSTVTALSVGGTATTINIGPTGNDASSIILSGGSADTGCTVDGATGALTCTGPISGSGITATALKWNALTVPDGNLSLAMGAHITAFNWATGTSTNDLFSLTSDASADGTGSLLNIQTGASATLLPLRVRAGATEALAVDATGKVGIGTTAPTSVFSVGSSSQFQVNSTGAIAAATGITSSGTINFSGLTASSGVYTDGSKNLTSTPPTSGQLGYWTRTGTNLYNTTLTDNVGIGTSAPDKTLEINSATGANLRLTYNDSNGTAANYSDFNLSATGDLTITPSGGQVVLADTATLNVGGLTDVVYNAFANAAETPVSTAITADNDLFIGGDFEVKGGLYLTGRNIYNTVGGVSTAAISLATDPTTQNLYNSLTYGSWLVQNTINDGLAALMVNQMKGGDIFTASASSVPKFTIKNDGKVGIGTTSPAATLDTVAPIVKTDTTLYGYPVHRLSTNEITANYPSSLGIAFVGAAAQANRTWQFQTGEDTVENTGNISFQAYGGRVGIGTNAPAGKLEVSEPTNASLYTVLRARGGNGLTSSILFATNTSGGVNTGGSIGHDGASDTLFLAYSTGGGSTKDLVINSSGNVGIGTTSPGAKLEVAGTGDLNIGKFSGNSATYGTIWTTNSATGGPAFYAYQGNVIVNSGNVGIGTTGPNYPLEIVKNQNSQTQVVLSNSTSGTAAGVAYTLGNNASSAYLGLTSSGWTASGPIYANQLSLTNLDSGGLGLGVVNASGNISFYTGSTGTTKMTILSGGNITMGGTNTGVAVTVLDINYAGGGTQYGIEFEPSADTTCPLYFDNASAAGVGSVCTTNSATAYNTSSDARLKENIKDTSFGIDTLQKIQVKDFNFISDPDKKMTQGFIAQDLYQIYPYAVTVGGDDPRKNPWSVDYGRITPLIIKAVQDQQGEIASLSGQLANLTLTDTGDLNIQINTNVTNNTNTYQLTNKDNIIDSVTAFGQMVAANIKSGAIVTQEIAANSFTAFQGTIDNLLIKSGLVTPNVQVALISPLPDQTDVTVQLGKGQGVNGESQEGKLAIQNSDGAEVASINSQGDATFSGTVNSQQLTVNSQATISGTLYAGDIKSKSLDDIQALLTSVQTDQNLLKDAVNWNVSTASAAGQLDILTARQLFITDQAAVNSLSVTNTVTVGTDLVFQSSLDPIYNILNTSINSLSAPLKIQSLAMAPLEIMAGLIKIDTHGNMTIAGDLFVAGRIKSSGLTLTNSDTTTPDSLLSLQDQNGTQVAGVNASGSAEFNNLSTQGLTIAGADATVSGTIVNGVITTNSTIGTATIPAGVTEITIKNPKITDYTLVYVTPTSGTQNNVLYVKSKEAGQFVVGFTNAINTDASFNWWIVQVQN